MEKTNTRRIKILLFVVMTLLLCGVALRPARFYLQGRLSEAVHQNDVNSVRLLLRMGANPKAASSEGFLFTRAVELQETEIARLLLERGADVEASERARLTERASPACYMLLRQHGYPGNLGGAIRAGDTKDVQALLDQGRSVNEKDAYGATPLIIALERHQAEIAKLLMARGADVNQAWRDASPLSLALKDANPDLDLIALLKAKGAHLSLLEAIRMNDVQAVRECLRNGAEVKKLSKAPGYYFLPLFVASMMGNDEIVRLLREAGANVNQPALNGYTPLMQAAYIGNAAHVRALLALGADKNAADDSHITAVQHALRGNHPDIYRLLKEEGARVDLSDAIVVNDVDTIRKLVHQGVNINLPSRQGVTPLMLAASQGQVLSLQALLDLGARLEATAGHGETALLRVARTEQTECARILLERGANPNALDASGKSALMKAAEAGRLEMLRLLLDKGATLNAVTPNGETALTLAETRKQPSAASLLRQAAAGAGETVSASK